MIHILYIIYDGLKLKPATYCRWRLTGIAVFFFQCEDMTPIVAVSGNHGTKSGPPKIGKELMVERCSQTKSMKKTRRIQLGKFRYWYFTHHGSSAMGRCQFDWCGFRLCTHRCLEIRSFVFPHVGLRERSFEIWERIWGEASSKGMKCIVLVWVVVSNIFYFHPYLGKWSKLTNIFQMGWNHQLVVWFAASSHN